MQFPVRHGVIWLSRRHPLAAVSAGAALLLLFYALVKPALGIGIYDLSLIGWDLAFATGYVWMTLALLTALSLHLLWQPRGAGGHSIIGLVWLLGVCLAVQVVRVVNSDGLLIVNILAGLLWFNLLYWCRSAIPWFRPLLPAFLIGISSYYALFIVAHAAGIAPAYQGMHFFYAGTERLAIIFAHPNHLGNLLAFCLILLASFTVTASRPVSVVALWLLLAPIVYGLLATYSRGAWLGCLVGLVVTLWLLRGRAPWTRLALSCLGLSVLLLGGQALLRHPRTVTARIITSAPVADAAIGNRLHVWRGATRLIADHGLWGVGIGQFGPVFNARYKPAPVQHESYASALNNYLTLAAEAGLPLAVLYLVTLGWALLLAIRGAARSGLPAGAEIGLVGGVVSLLVFAGTTYTLTRVYAGFLTWSVLGYLVAGAMSSPRTQGGAPLPPAAAPPAAAPGASNCPGDFR